ncbi:MAG: endopeptidase La [Bdellovibrionales bacterium]
METQKIYPVLPIRNTVTMPGTTVPLVVGRARSAAAVQYAQSQDGLIVVVTQQNSSQNEPQATDLYKTGTLCRLESVNGSEERGYQILITGIERFTIQNYFTDGDFITAEGDMLPDDLRADSVRRVALFHSLKDAAKDILALLPQVDEAILRLIDKLENPSQLTFLCATYLNVSLETKQELLETKNVEERMEKLLALMQKEREVLEVQKDIREKMTERLSRAQRDGLLREQMRAIQEELGESEGAVKDELVEKIKKAKLPEEVQKVADKELERLEHIPPASAEYHVIRNYLEWLAGMPWHTEKSEPIDLVKAREILDNDHYGLEKVKNRIIQYLAVAKLKNDLKGPILCLVGPPGVGKTSLGQSIAKALGREFVRTSLGGVRDESEIRGHRRTYVGAMPGRIVQSLKRVGVNNPLMMLDEIDKLGASYTGDPASAMLELLDPEQNKNFYDHYLDVPFDLSNTFFIATANMIDTIPHALRDRLEIIHLSSYTYAEKLHIAKKYLVPKQLQEHGLKPEQLEIPDELLTHIAVHYTREAGVRELQRTIASVCRYAAEQIVSKNGEKVVVSEALMPDILGLIKFHPEVTDKVVRPGIVTGLAWTPFGGDILSIEASVMPGTGQLRLTGQLGDVMKESAQIASSYIRSELSKFTSNYFYDKHDIHVHVPSGAIPKDGPSAGVTLLTAVTSLLLNKSVDPQVAMTGEITLRGSVLPVGGIKEKVLAAHRAGCKTLFLPKRNAPDYSEVPEEVRKQLTVHFVEDVHEVLSKVLGLEGIIQEREQRYRGLKSVEAIGNA